MLSVALPVELIVLGQQIPGGDRATGGTDTMKGGFEPSGLEAVVYSRSVEGGRWTAPGDEEDE